MRETILIFNLTDKSTRLQIEKALFPLKLRLRYVSKENYNQPLGALAGLKELPLAEEPYIGEELPDTMFVFAFLPDAKLNQVLASLRRSGAGPFPYKAVLTPVNQFWTVPECFREIASEHEAMNS